MKKLLLLVFLLSLSSAAFANTTTTIDFEQLPEFTQVTNQYAPQGANFSNALQLVVPDYDYFDFPPHSGSGVITNDPDDPIQVNFTNTFIVDANFWYAAPGGIVANAYDSHGGLITSVIGPAIDGSNLWVDLVSPTTGIAWITVSADLGADQVTLDDLSFTAGTPSVPEPGSFALVGSGLLAVAGILRRKIGC